MVGSYDTSFKHSPNTLNSVCRSHTLYILFYGMIDCGMFIIRVNKAVVGFPIISENYRAFFNYPGYLSFKGFRLSVFYNFNPYSPVSLPYAENRKFVFGSSAVMKRIISLFVVLFFVVGFSGITEVEAAEPTLAQCQGEPSKGTWLGDVLDDNRRAKCCWWNSNDKQSRYV